MTSSDNIGTNNGEFKKPVLVASAALMWVPSNRVAVVKRRDNEAGMPTIINPGKEELPSGKWLAGDTSIADIMYRELGEELDIRREHLHRICRAVHHTPIINLESGRALVINRVKMVLRRMPKIKLKEGRSDHVRVRFLSRDEFLDIASDDPSKESEAFVPQLEPFLREIFDAAHVRGCILDALAPGVELSVRAVTFSRDGRRILYNPANFTAQPVGTAEHVDDVLRTVLPVAAIRVKKKTIFWRMVEERTRKGIKAELGIILTSPEIDNVVSLPAGYEWLDTSSSDIHRYIERLPRGFQKGFLEKATARALRPYPPFLSWAARDSELLRKPKRNSGTSLKV